MASINQVIEGLKILAKYEKDPASPFGICAEHDIIYAAHNVGEGDLSPEDAKLIDDLGWHFSEDTGCWALFV